MASGAEAGIEPLDGADEEREDRCGQLGVVGEAAAEMPRERQLPLADSDRGEDPVDEVGGGVGHGSAAARGAEAAALAAERDEEIVSADPTPDTREATLESATPEVALQSAADEHGEPASVRRTVPKGWEPGGEQPVQVGLLRLTTGVSRWERRGHGDLAPPQERGQYARLVFSSTSQRCEGSSVSSQCTTGRPSTDQSGPDGPARA